MVLIGQKIFRQILDARREFVVNSSCDKEETRPGKTAGKDTLREVQGVVRERHAGAGALLGEARGG